MNQDVQSTEGGSTAHLFAVNLLEKLVSFLKGLLTGNFLGFCSRWLTRLGHWAIIVAAILIFIFALIVAIKSNQFSGFLDGIKWMLLLFVAQYTAHKFLPAGENLIRDNPSQVASKNFLICVGFLAAIGGVALFVIAVIDLIKIGSFPNFLSQLGTCIILEFIAVVAFNPGEANVEEIEHNSAGQEAIGIVTFFVKTIMRLVPILFGALIIVFTVMMFIEGIKLFGDGAGFAWMRIGFIINQIFYYALFPIAAYLSFLLAYLAIDVVKAILSIPENK